LLVRFAEGCPPSAKLSIAADYAGVHEPYLGWRAFHAPRVLENLYLANSQVVFWQSCLVVVEESGALIKWQNNSLGNNIGLLQCFLSVICF